MGKNIKSYATIQVHFPRKGREALRQKVQISRLQYGHGLTVHIIRFSNYKQNFQNCLPQSNSSELRKFRTVCPHSPRIPQNSHIRTFYIMFQTPAPAENPAKFQRITQIPRSSPTQSANHAKFAHFVNLFYIMFQAPASQRTLSNSSELRKFRTIRPHSPRITRNSHHLLTLHLTFQMPDQWQTTP